MSIPVSQLDRFLDREKRRAARGGWGDFDDRDSRDDPNYGPVYSEADLEELDDAAAWDDLMRERCKRP
jgi:hypothetical protein